MGHLKAPEIQAIFSNFHHIFTNFDNIFKYLYFQLILDIWLTKFAYKNKILQKNSMAVGYEAEQIDQIYGPFRCPIFEFFEKLIP